MDDGFFKLKAKQPRNRWCFLATKQDLADMEKRLLDAIGKLDAARVSALTEQLRESQASLSAATESSKPKGQ